MVYYLEEVDESVYPQYLWFSGSAAETLEIASLFQAGYLSKEYIKSVGSYLLVKVGNPDGFHFKKEKGYNLHFRCSRETKGAIVVKHRAEEDEYFNRHYGNLRIHIVDKTWNELFSDKQHVSYDLSEGLGDIFDGYYDDRNTDEQELNVYSNIYSNVYNLNNHVKNFHRRVNENANNSLHGHVNHYLQDEDIISESESDV